MSFLFIIQLATTSVFLFPIEIVYLKLLILWRYFRKQHFMIPRWLVQVLYPLQKFERSLLWNGFRYMISKYEVEVALSGMIYVLNFINIYQYEAIKGDTRTGNMVMS
jgi:hypothetical protein